MTFTPETLLARLHSLPVARRYCVAFSGGVDSHVLLHALVQIKNELPSRDILVLHVNHGIHPDAAQWSRHCEMVCRELGVEFESHTLNLTLRRGDSLEAVAREARYRLFARLMQHEDMLLLAQHQDDQSETLLLQLFRGSGPKGLASMPACVPFAQGWLARPLLEQNRDSLLGYAMAGRLPWIEDPSNQNTVFDRNYLRHIVLPSIRQRWPALNNTLARAAQHQAEAATLLDELAKQDIDAAGGADPGMLPLRVLDSLPPPRQRNVLRYWLHNLCALPLPSTVHLQRILDEILPAGIDALPLVRWSGAEVRRYREVLYAMAPFAPIEAEWMAHWDLQTPLVLPDGGMLHWRYTRSGALNPARLKQGVSVRYRQGGERCKLPGRDHHHSLKHLLQDWGVPPWQRDRIPLIFVGEELAQIVGYACCTPFVVEENQSGIEIIVKAADAPIETADENKDNSPGCTP